MELNLQIKNKVIMMLVATFLVLVFANTNVSMAREIKDPEVPKEEHVFTNGIITKEPSYSEEGERVSTCQDCGIKKKIAIPKIDHEHKGGIANCVNKAICEVCNEEYGEYNKKSHKVYTGHIVNQMEATCTQDGYTGDTLYDCCNAVITKGNVIPKLGHQYDNGKDVKEATGEEEGQIEYVCKICGESKIVNAPLETSDGAGNVPSGEIVEKDALENEANIYNAPVEENKDTEKNKFSLNNIFKSKNILGIVAILVSIIVVVMFMIMKKMA